MNGLVFGTLLCGWMSDKLFKGRRAPAGILFMVGVFIAVLVYWLNPHGNQWLIVSHLSQLDF